MLTNATNKPSFKTILACGLLVGTLDILSAFVDYRISSGKSNVTFILNYIASAVFGKDAYGDDKMALLGLLFHYIIAISFTFLFFALYNQLKAIFKNWIVLGVVYGLFIWMVMNLVVVRMTNIPVKPISEIKWDKALKGALILIFMIGLPLSFMANRLSKKKM